MEVAVTKRDKEKQQAMKARLSGVQVGEHGSLRQSGHSTAKLSMYLHKPSGVQVSIEDFEELALARLRVLKRVEEGRAGGRTHDEMDEMVQDLCNEHLKVPGNPEESERKDTVSHFILRLGYCRTEELRRWFLSQECALFRHRFRRESAEAQMRFMEEHGLPYKAIFPKRESELNSGEEGSRKQRGEATREELEQVWRSFHNGPMAQGIDQTVFYKVPFEEVPDLVASRKVLMRKGFAYVPREQVAAIVVGHFRAALSKALVITNRLWMKHFHIEERERLTPIVESLSTRYLGEDYSDPQARGVGHVSLDDLDRLSQESFPLCMRHLYTRLKDVHHLKHGGRLQLGLFLKGIGLRMEDAMSFWRAEFSEKMGVDRFDKEYAYSIRHNYGKEGKRTDYTPFSCAKIIQSTPGVGDCHGCPFRHFSDDNLGALLQRVGVPARAAAEIRAKAKQSHFQIACGMTFSATQPQPCPDAGVSHPNQYYDWSMKARQGIKINEPSRSSAKDTQE